MNDIVSLSPFVPDVSVPSSPEDSSFNQILYPNKFDNVLGELTNKKDLKKKWLFQIIYINDEKLEDDVKNEVLPPNIEKIIE